MISSVKNIALLLLVSFLATGCDSQHEGTVTVKNNPPVIEIINDLENPVFYRVVDSQTAAAMRFGDPCQNFQPNLSAGNIVNLNYTDIMGYDENSESFWFMWTDCQSSGDSETIPIK